MNTVRDALSDMPPMSRGDVYFVANIAYRRMHDRVKLTAETVDIVYEATLAGALYAYLHNPSMFLSEAI